MRGRLPRSARSVICVWENHARPACLYPNNFIAGDNLFQDYQVDFARADDESLNPGDRHILRNVRDVVVRGQQATTCLTCHQVHANSIAKHSAATRGAICADCHGTKFTLEVKPYAVHSALCEY